MKNSLIIAGSIFVAAATGSVCSTSIQSVQNLEAAEPLPVQAAAGSPADRADDFESFGEIMFERILTYTEPEPVFVDIDNGFFITAPRDVLPATEATDTAQEEQHTQLSKDWKLTFSQWVRESGVDLAIQPEAGMTTAIGFDLHAGEPVRRPHKLTVVAELLGLPKEAATGTTYRRQFDPSTGGYVPFLTREGGLGMFYVAPTDLRGENSVQFDYQLSRGEEVAELTGRPVKNTPSAQLLDEFSGFVYIGVADGVLGVWRPGHSELIEVAGHQAILRRSNDVILRGRRLVTTSLDIDAVSRRVKLYGRGREAELQLVGDLVHLQFDGETYAADRFSLLMPEVRIYKKLPPPLKTDAENADAGSSSERKTEDKQ